MTNISLEQSQKIAVAAAAKGAELGLKPLCITVLDSRASLRLCVNQDGTSIDRHRIAPVSYTHLTLPTICSV